MYTTPLIHTVLHTAVIAFYGRKVWGGTVYGVTKLVKNPYKSETKVHVECQKQGIYGSGGGLTKGTSRGVPGCNMYPPKFKGRTRPDPGGYCYVDTLARIHCRTRLARPLA